MFRWRSQPLSILSPEHNRFSGVYYIRLPYIHYKALDQKTMTNVHNWLFDYFVKQTSMMVDIYKVNKELKGNTIG